ncbi:hypothetical protein CRM89_29875 [Nocardia sp. FDAARGOS_372]|uniref:Uncharacterized protein n=1 Tax=Nocardia farcinica (strain IFM 10152) TaxID=247156 RepID=Q5YM59_NOCFA|nr:hypothetical protein CRM89_29875 [Nocardia sp. FDAARGOS_372]BAD60732.1 hypothetical protein PNF2_470 [Nocardia farcinica IFM 10152]
MRWRDLPGAAQRPYVVGEVIVVKRVGAVDEIEELFETQVVEILWSEVGVLVTKLEDTPHLELLVVLFSHPAALVLTTAFLPALRVGSPRSEYSSALRTCVCAVAVERQRQQHTNGMAADCGQPVPTLDEVERWRASPEGVDAAGLLE